jgi:hypothetical protein
MAVIDLTRDARLESQIASNVGSGIGGYFRNRRQKNQLAEQKQRKQLQQAETIKLLNSGLQGQELLAAMNEMPDAINNQMVQQMNQRALQHRISGNAANADRDVNELERLNNMRSKLHKWDGTLQQFVLVPGGEELLKGIDMGIKNTTARIVAAEQARKAGVEDVAGVARQQLGIGGEVAETDQGFGLRNDGVTQKGNGFFGKLKLIGGGIATEYTTQSNAVKENGERIDFPSLVPTMTKDEVLLMIDDIIPNRKDIPESIMRKAIDHANQRISEGKSVFAEEGEQRDLIPRKGSATSAPDVSEELTDIQQDATDVVAEQKADIGKKKLDAEMARKLLKEAQGDKDKKDKARELARQRGFRF